MESFQCLLLAIYPTENLGCEFYIVIFLLNLIRWPNLTEWVYLVDVNCPCLVVVRVCNFVQMILLVTSGKEQLVL